AQLAAAGATVVAVFDATPPAEHAAAALRVLAHLPSAALGVRLLGELGRRKVKVYRGWAISEIRGERAVASLRARRGPGHRAAEIELDGEAVCLSNGLVPAVELAALRGCALAFDETLGVWEVERRDGISTSEPGVFAIGDGASVGGARKAI